MIDSDDAVWDLAGYGLWVAGSVLFGVASFRARDWLAFIGSTLFFVGIVLVMVPMVRSLRRRD